MGAISSQESLPILRKYLSDSERSVRETCEIAIARIEWDNSEEGKKHAETLNDDSFIPYAYFTIRFRYLTEVTFATFRTYTSIDPAPATSGLLSGVPIPNDVTQENIDRLQSQLLDTERPLFERYRAMFALRNIGTPAAVDALAAGFSDDSALFKYVLRLSS